MKKILFLLLFIISCVNQPETVINYPYKVNWNNINTISYPQHKPIIIYVSSKYCNICDKFNMTTLNDDKVAYKINNNFVPILISDYKRNVNFGYYLDKFKIDAFPTIITLNNKKELARLNKYNDVFGMNVYLDLSIMAFQLDNLNDIAQQLINILDKK